MSLLGLDLSLRAAGLALAPRDWAPGLDWRRVLVRTVGLALPNDASELAKVRRIVGIANAIVGFALKHEVTDAFLEGYAYSQALSRAHALGELGGAVKLRLYDAGIRIHVLTASRARSPLGAMPRKGAKAAAHQVLRELGCPEDWTGDEKDAFVVLNAGMLELGHGGIVVPRAPQTSSKKATRRKAA